MTFHKNKLTSDLLASCVFTLLFALVIWPILTTPFSIGDDHRILAMNAPEKMDTAYIKTLYSKTPDLSGSVVIDAQIGRFRPVSWLWVKIQCLLFGDNFLAWRISNLFILCFSVLFLSLIIGKLGGKRVAKWIILAVYVFGRNNETWWTLIPPAQNVGELFLLAGFYFWLRFREINYDREKYIALVLFCLSALVKESFIFCLPFVGLIDLLFFNPQKKVFTATYGQLFLVFIIPFGILLSVILISKNVYGYPDEKGVFSIVGYNTFEFFYSSVFLVAPILLFFFNASAIAKSNFSKILIFILIWLMVQLLLLKGIRMDGQHHYLIPGLLPVLILSALAIQNFKQHFKIIGNILILIYFSFVVLQTKNTFVNARYYSAGVTSFYKMTGAIKRSSPKRIVYMSHFAFPGDWILGTSAVFRHQGIKPSFYFCSINDSIPPWQIDFWKSRLPNQFPNITWKEFVRDIQNKEFLEKGDWIIFPDFVCQDEELPPGLKDTYLEGRGAGVLIEGKLIFYETPYYDLQISKIMKGENLLSKVGYYAIQKE